MHYNFRRLDGREWCRLIKRLQKRKLEFVKVASGDLYNPKITNNIFKVYYYASIANCKIIYYDFINNKWHKTLREISFTAPEIDVDRCVITFRKIASKFNENIGYEPTNRPYTNGVYSYYKTCFEGEVTVLDMNSAYLWALSKPLADWTTKEECTRMDVYLKKYDYYCFENLIYKEMFYKDDERMQGAMLWAGVKIYGFRSKIFYSNTIKELYRLKTEVNKEKYKNVANITVGCMHKHSGYQNNQTIAASLYAFFEWYIRSLVVKFNNKGYDVIMLTTDSIKIPGDYNEADNIVHIGDKMGEFKVEYKGHAKYMSQGHYEEEDVKWKGMPEYMRKGLPKCKFIEDVDKERKIYEKYAIVQTKKKK